MYYKITELDLKTLDRIPSVGTVARSIASALHLSGVVRRVVSIISLASVWFAILVCVLFIVSLLTGYERWLDIVVAGFNR